MSTRPVWFERNEEAERLEREGREDEAFRLYRQNADEGCTLSFTYERLAAIHRRRGEHREEAEALARGIAVEKERGPSTRLARLETQLTRARRLEARPAPKRRRSAAADEPRPAVRASPAREKKGCLGSVLVLATTAVLAAALA